MKTVNHAATAFYVFDVSEAIRRAQWLRKQLPPETALCYAVKANPFLIRDLAPHVERLELCSPGEAEICRELHIAPEKMVISGVYKSPDFIEQLVADGADRIYTVESLTQFLLLRRLSERHDKNLRLLLRLTNDSQFGMDETEIRAIVGDRADYPQLDLIGLEYFSGTQKTSLKKLRREIQMLDRILGELKDDYGYRAEELEYGPGFPVAYFEEEELDEEALLQGFSELLDTMEHRTQITLELGRSLAASCGTYYTHVVDSKCSRGQRYLMTDGGMHQLVYYGQHMAMRHPRLTVVGKEGRPTEATWNICGALCSMNDLLAKQVPLPAVEIGDVLRFENAGAYCMTEGSALFLSRELPGIYLRHGEGLLQCVRSPQETYTLNMPQL